MDRITGDVDISDVKRFQIPGAIVDIKCPKCGDVCGIELVDQISYPSTESKSWHTIAFECENCDIEVGRRVRIVSVIATLDIEESKIV